MITPAGSQANAAPPLTPQPASGEVRQPESFAAVLEAALAPGRIVSAHRLATADLRHEQQASAEMFNQNGFFGAVAADRGDATPLKPDAPGPIVAQLDRRSGLEPSLPATAGGSPRPAVPAHGPLPADQEAASPASAAAVAAPRPIRAGTLAAPPPPAALHRSGPDWHPVGILASATPGAAAPERPPLKASRQAPPRDHPNPPRAASPTVVALGTGGAGISVTAQAPGLAADERERLERRIAGELARHGLAIGRIMLSARAVAGEQKQGRSR